MRPIKSEVARVIANTLYQMHATGYTINEAGEKPVSGYQVSIIDGPVFNNALSVDVLAVKKFIEENLDAGSYAGVWTDKETGKIYFDISVNYLDILEAADRAEECNQIAIWDHVDKREWRKDALGNWSPCF